MITEIEAKEQLTEIVKTLANIVNNMGFDYEKNTKVMIDEFHCTHRTLQQNIIRLLALFIKNNTEVKYSDLRNEDSVNWCKEVSKIEQYFSHV